MKRDSVLVIGAGASGLAAAKALSAAGLDVTILEARDRVGGRIHPVPSRSGLFPIELGAEFIHGAKHKTWEFLHSAGLETIKVTDRHWEPGPHGLVKRHQFWDQLSLVMSRIDRSGPDESFASFLTHLNDVPGETRELARDYVEGFHAAHTDIIGTHALAKAEAAAQAEEGTQQFRIVKGYGALLDWFGKCLRSAGVPIHLNTSVEEIQWRTGEVRVLARTGSGTKTYSATCALITLPLGVLKSHQGGLRFRPPVPAKEKAIEALAMGSVAKLILEFKEPFWPDPPFGFLHLRGAPLPTWWSDERGPVLTAWVGGPKVEGLLDTPLQRIVEEAVALLSSSFKLSRNVIQNLLVSSYLYNWKDDPFSRGAYSYTPSGMIDMPTQLGTPVAGTLFFAGEATDSSGDQGTVHGALTSGLRAAGQITAKNPI